MKKRSLFAAVAMLIVSAIVLTSATYAWFTAGSSTVTVGAIKGQVVEASAGIKLRVNQANSTWRDSLDYKTLAPVTGNHFATNYTTTGELDNTANGFAFLNPTEAAAQSIEGFGYYEPVSADPTVFSQSGVPTFYGYTLSGSNFDDIDSQKALTDFYDVYSFYVATISESDTYVENETDVTVTLKITGSAASAARVAVYANDGSGWAYKGVFSGANESGWKPIINDLDPTNNKYYVDANTNYILNDGDTVPAGATAIASTKTGDTDNRDGCLTADAVPVTTAGSAGATFTLDDVHKMGGLTYTPEGESNAVTMPNTLVKAFVWLEGNDLNCAPTQTGIAGGELSVAWDFAPAT